MKKRKTKLKYKFIYISIIISLIGILLLITSVKLNDNRNLNFLEKAIKDPGTYIQRIVYYPFKQMREGFAFLKEEKNLYNDYIKLKEKEEKVEIYYSQIRELQKEVSELKQVLELNATLSEYSYVNATVVNRNIGYWYDILTIDKGLKNGIKKGDAVITNSGLIGKISDLSNFSSTVKLLTTDRLTNKISVKIDNEYGYQYGLLAKYDKEKRVYILEGITDSNNIKDGDIVTTTGLTDYFPSGIIIGSVSRVVKDEYDLNTIVEVIPKVNFDDISIVTILNRKAYE